MRSIAVACVGMISLVACGNSFDTPSSEPVARLSTNRLSTNRLSTNRLSTNSLSAQALAAAAAGDIATLAQDPELLEYVLLCALDSGTTVTVNGVGYEGGFGFAPEIATRAMTSYERQWMWGCLEAHANALGIEVPISVRGDHANLRYASFVEQQLFPFHEGAFFGDGFNPSMFFNHRYTAEGEAILRNQLGGWMTYRLCGRQAQICGFTNVGFARQTDPHACEAEQQDGGDVRCHNPAASDPASSGTFAWQSVTTYLQYLPWEECEEQVCLPGGGNECEEDEVLVFFNKEWFCEKRHRCSEELGVEGAFPQVSYDDDGNLHRECAYIKPDGEDLSEHTGHGEDSRLGFYDAAENEYLNLDCEFGTCAQPCDSAEQEEKQESGDDSTCERACVEEEGCKEERTYFWDGWYYPTFYWQD